jgi:hypothetical protein
VSKHVFQGQDWATFKHFGVAEGWPVTTSPWRVAFASPQQKVLDRREEWWAARAGLAPLPRVERIVWLPWVGEQQVTDMADKARLRELFRKAMAAGAAGPPPHVQLPPDSDEHDVLAELAHGGEPIRQRRLLAPDLRPRALAAPAGAVIAPRQRRHRTSPR